MRDGEIMNKKKIALIGALGNGVGTSSGQIIRTKILNNELKKHYGENNIVISNTSLVLENPVKFVFNFLKACLYSTHIIVILSQNGMRIIWPVLSLLSKFFSKKIYNNMVGGNLITLVDKYPKLLKYMKTFEINWVQSTSIQKELALKGINNTEWLPNSKPIRILNRDEIRSFESSPYKFCTFSRISKPKGIELAIEAIKRINKEAGKTLVTLHIYGKPDDDYEEHFLKLLKEVPEYIKYGGIIPYDQSVETLRNYYMLLFPTTFEGEGFPGTVIDAYASGVPVIASSWRFNTEFIKDRKTGIIFEYDQPEQLKEKIEWAIQHPHEVDNMRCNCLYEAWKYTPEKVYSIVFKRIDKERNESIMN